jgi:hypothetical protein
MQGVLPEVHGGKDGFSRPPGQPRDSNVCMYNPEKKKIDFPTGVPTSRFPKQDSQFPKQGFKKKALLAEFACLPSHEDRLTSADSISGVLGN